LPLPSLNEACCARVAWWKADDPVRFSAGQPKKRRGVGLLQWAYQNALNAFTSQKLPATIAARQPASRTIARTGLLLATAGFHETPQHDSPLCD
jgi:hypothetical protein